MTEVQEFFIRVAEIVGYWECDGLISWQSDLEPYIVCNDMFAPAADTEDITPTDLPLFVECLALAGPFGPKLFCCRKRNMKLWKRRNFYSQSPLFEEYQP